MMGDLVRSTLREIGPCTATVLCRNAMHQWDWTKRKAQLEISRAIDSGAITLASDWTCRLDQEGSE